MRVVRAAAVLLGLAAPVALTFACGSRTGLLTADTLAAGPDGGPSLDAPFIDDVPLPPPDVILPTFDARPIRDVNRSACADASDTLIYVVTTSNTLLKFDPSSAQFSVIGRLVCPDSRQPFSMAVDRKGAAYVLYAAFQDPTPGKIFRVSLDTAACLPTSFVPGQRGFNSFGMGFAADDVGPGETLYVASDDAPTGRLGAVNETTLTLTSVGSFFPAVQGAELTGTGDGRLFAFFAPNGAQTQGSAIAQIDKTNARVSAEVQLPTVTQGGGWAFAFWGGDFYLFTAPHANDTPPDPTTTVTRYNPTTGTVTDVAHYPETIDGAGVSTCAPVQ